MTDRNRSVGFIFGDIARFRGITFDQLMKPFGLTLAQAYVLNYLFRQDGLTQIELAEHMDVGTVTVSGLVDRLEARGWVKRKTDVKDRRAKQVWLTRESDAVRKEMIKQFKELNNVTLDGITDDEIEVLCDLLSRVRKNLSTNLDRS